jgi:F420-non-reducing hydrogenase iron-sulfur subunit
MKTMAPMHKHYGLCEDCDRDAACTLKRSVRLAIIECEEFVPAQPRVSKTNKTRGGMMPSDPLEQTLSLNVKSVEDCPSPDNCESFNSQDRRFAVFICANCARSGQNGSSDSRLQPNIPNFNWPYPVQQMTIPCAGRLQPEHVLKAFSSGVSMVCVIACAEDNCHYVEGSKRCARRADYVRSILKQIGLERDRLLLCHLPGSAAEDMAVAAGKAASTGTLSVSDAQVTSIRDEVLRTLLTLPQNPIPQFSTAVETRESFQEEMDISEDDNNE